MIGLGIWTLIAVDAAWSWACRRAVRAWHTVGGCGDWLESGAIIQRCLRCRRAWMTSATGSRSRLRPSGERTVLERDYLQ